MSLFCLCDHVCLYINVFHYYTYTYIHTHTYYYIDYFYIDENSFSSNNEKHAKIDLQSSHYNLCSLIVSSGSFQHAKGSVNILPLNTIQNARSTSELNMSKVAKLCCFFPLFHLCIVEFILYQALSFCV